MTCYLICLLYLNDPSMTIDNVYFYTSWNDYFIRLFLFKIAVIYTHMRIYIIAKNFTTQTFKYQYMSK